MPDPATQRASILQQISAPGALPPLDDAPVSSTSDVKAPGSVSRWAKILYGAGAGADIASTLRGFAQGAHEANPLVNFAGDKAAIPIGLGEELGALFLAKKLLGDRHPKIMNALLAGGGLLHGAAALHNLSIPSPKDAPSQSLGKDLVVYDTGNGGFVHPK